MLHAVIMAGGSGTRFWPASRNRMPKQLLHLVGERSMLQATSDRLEGLVSAEQTLVMTNKHLVAPVREQLPDVPPEQIVGEPMKRDTAACIALAASLIHNADPDAIMLVLPADHVISTDQQFHDCMQSGVQLIEKAPDRIVTFGIRPTYAAESFGYVQRGEAISDTDVAKAFHVASFREKPDRQTAEQYLQAGTYDWNSGIFMWRAATILKALREYEPEMMQHIDAISASMGTPGFAVTLEREFEQIDGRSIDYAVMERYPDVAVVEASFSWDDVGSWQAIGRLTEPDLQGNCVRGHYLPIQSQRMIVYGEDEHLVVTIGMQDMIVVHTSNATLIAPKAEEESVREVVKQLQTRDWTDYL
ncbi:MAG TPA: mannose-1-phosphate guanylyltransferase [Planctomycetaceae bacterium]|nr:mannose-1-phosphate guanylyltransferase [Planctomycetaceae bacterium]